MRRLLCVLVVACSNAPPPEPVASAPQSTATASTTQPTVRTPQPVADDFYAGCEPSPPPEPCGEKEPEVVRVASRLVTINRPFALYIGGVRDVWTDDAGDPQGGPTNPPVRISPSPPKVASNAP